MKKTLFALIALGGLALGDVTTSTHITAGSKTIEKGTVIKETETGVYTLGADMTFGSNSSFQAAKNDLLSTNISLSNYSIGNYTASVWVTGDSLAASHMLIAFGHVTNNTALGYTGLMWNADTQTMTYGRGIFNAANDTITFGTGAVTSTALSSLISSDAQAVNITLVSSQTGTNVYDQTVSLYINGELAYTSGQLDSRMNGSGSSDPSAVIDTYTWLSQNAGVKYGTVKLTNEALSGDKVSGFAGIVPEPATATLSLLALAGLAARRRRK